MEIPEDLKYTQTHEWIRFEKDGYARVGITDYAQEILGDVVYVSLPHAGVVFKRGDIFADVESVKRESEIYMPIAGKVISVNMALAEQPHLVNKDPYGSWLVEMKDVKHEGLLSANEYKAFVQDLATSA